MREIKLVLPTSWPPDRTQFFDKLGIKSGGLAAQLFDDVFDCLFAHSVDAKRDFNMYYVVEYGTLEFYLEARYGIVLDNQELEKNYIFLCPWLPTLIDGDWEGSKLDEVLESIQDLENEHENED